MDKGCSPNMQEKSSAKDVGKKKMEPISTKASVTISYVSKPSTSAESVASMLASPSTSHSVSVTSVPTAKIKPPQRPNVICTSILPCGSVVSATTSSLKDLTIASAHSAQSTVIQSLNNATSIAAEEHSDVTAKPEPVSVIRKASHDSPCVSVEAVPFSFKTPSPLRLSGTSKSSTEVIRPSVSVSVVKNDHAKVPATILATSPRTSHVPSVKIASFAKAQPSSTSTLIVNTHNKEAQPKQPLSLKPTLRSLPTTAFDLSTNKKATSGFSNPLRKKVFNAAVSSASGSPSPLFSSLSSPQSVIHKATPKQSLSATSKQIPPSSSKNGKNSDDEEEFLVYVQFDSQLDSDLLQPDTDFKVIGIDSKKPVLQLGDQVFEGDWHDTIGTSVFFEEDTSCASAGDPVFTKNPEQPLKYCCKTRKTLHMSRIFIKPTEPDNEDTEEVSPVDTLDVEEPLEMDVEDIEQEAQ